jgi:hypothetical protein
MKTGAMENVIILQCRKPPERELETETVRECARLFSIQTISLTDFLPKDTHLDNNWAENTLRIMAVYRKAFLFFKTLNSALVMRDMFSLVAACEVNGINAFDYLNWIQRNWKKVQENPGACLP